MNAGLFHHNGHTVIVSEHSGNLNLQFINSEDSMLEWIDVIPLNDLPSYSRYFARGRGFTAKVRKALRMFTE